MDSTTLYTLQCPSISDARLRLASALGDFSTEEILEALEAQAAAPIVH